MLALKKKDLGKKVHPLVKQYNILKGMEKEIITERAQAEQVLRSIVVNYEALGKKLYALLLETGPHESLTSLPSRCRSCGRCRESSGSPAILSAWMLSSCCVSPAPTVPGAQPKPCSAAPRRPLSAHSGLAAPPAAGPE